jgi:hypothetical protein
MFNSTIIYILSGLLLVGGVWLKYVSLKSEISNAHTEIEERDHTIATYKIRLDEEKRINDENLNELDNLTGIYIKTLEALKQKDIRDKRRTVEITKLQEEIRDVKDYEDAPVAPVLYNTFEQLRQLQTAGTDYNNSNKSR